MKPIVKLIGFKRTYNMYQNANSLVYSLGKRPFSTMEKLSEKIKQRRHKDFIPQEKDVPQYDPQAFKKQMELEIMTISLDQRSYLDNGKIIPSKYRSVVRRPDHDGMF